MAESKSAAQLKADRARCRRRIADHHRRLHELDAMLGKAYADLENGMLSRDQFSGICRQYDAQAAAAREEIAEAERMLNRAEDDRSAWDALVPALKEYRETQTLTPELARRILRRVEVHETPKHIPKSADDVDVYVSGLGLWR